MFETERTRSSQWRVIMLQWKGLCRRRLLRLRRCYTGIILRIVIPFGHVGRVFGLYR